MPQNYATSHWGMGGGTGSHVPERMPQKASWRSPTGTSGFLVCIYIKKYIKFKCVCVCVSLKAAVLCSSTAHCLHWLSFCTHTQSVNTNDMNCEWRNLQFELVLFTFKGNENPENVDGIEKAQRAGANAEGAPPRVNPYSVITISPTQENEPSLSLESSPQDGSVSPTLSSGYSVPVPCGYAVPSNLPLILPAYTSPVIIRSVSVDEEGSVFLEFAVC